MDSQGIGEEEDGILSVGSRTPIHTRNLQRGQGFRIVRVYFLRVVFAALRTAQFKN